MFAAKQAVIVLSTFALIAAAALIILRAARADAQGERWDIYSGLVWSQPDQSDKRMSTLYLSLPDPYTGYTKASEDGVACKGTKAGSHLLLYCQTTGVRLDGEIRDQKSYIGEWTASTQELKGQFSYSFKKRWSKQ